MNKSRAASADVRQRPQSAHLSSGLHRLPLHHADFTINGIDTRIIAGRMLRYWIVRHLHRTSKNMTVAGLLHALGDAGFVVAGRPSKTLSDALAVETRRGRVSRTGWGRYHAGKTIPRSTRFRINTRLTALEVALGHAYEQAGRLAFQRFLTHHHLTECAAVFALPGLRPALGATQPVLVRAEILDASTMTLEKSVSNGQNRTTTPSP